MNHALRRGPTVDKVVSLATTGYSLFQLDKTYISIVYKIATEAQATLRVIKLLPLLERDSEMELCCHKETLSLMSKSPVSQHAASKKKEITFQVLNRNIWT
jgi:hypothetical protein